MDCSLASRLTSLCHTAEDALRDARRLIEHAPDRPANTPLAHIEALRALSAVSRLEASLKAAIAALQPQDAARAMLRASTADLDQRDYWRMKP